MGKVYIVGAGPGDVELLTLKAVRIIKEADVILYDRLVSEDILQLARPDCEIIYVGKEEGKHTPQDSINRMLVELSKVYRRVVRLKGGDPFVFGRGAEEALYLAQKGVEFEVVPGVSSVTGVPTYVGIPLTMRGVSSSFGVVTGHEGEGCYGVRWELSKYVDTLVVVMGVGKRQEIGRKLLELGRDAEEPVAFVERGCTSRQRVVVTSLGRLASDPPPVEPPALLVVGKVVDLINTLGKEVERWRQNPTVVIW
ncbi:uroporphyrinogen-III C-methyltransferase [Thermocrinis albus]|nr:uroporphyrinogen-III C-methyltransferase [Thermocrinis albus]